MKRYLLLLLLSVVTLSCSRGGGGREILIGRDPSWFPVDFTSRIKTVTAFSDDLLTAIAKEENFTANIVPASYKTMWKQLKAGSYDGMLTAITPAPELTSYFDFSDLYLPVGPVLIVRKGSGFNSMESLAGHIVGVKATSPSVLLVAKIPQVKITDYLQLATALQDLANGTIDGVVMEALDAYSYVHNLYPGTLEVATAPLTDEGLRLVVLKGDQRELLKLFNRGLQAVHKNGTYAALAAKWGLYL